MVEITNVTSTKEYVEYEYVKATNTMNPDRERAQTAPTYTIRYYKNDAQDVKALTLALRRFAKAQRVTNLSWREAFWLPVGTVVSLTYGRL